MRKNAIYLAFVCALLLHASDGDPSPEELQQSSESSGIDWGALLKQALLFDGVQQGFRVATQDYTRSRLGGKFFDDWGRSIGNLHGWSDGDYFLTNYVLHPIQGATNGFIFVQNDQKYKDVVFGRSREYWKSRSRATLFAFAASEEVELGPFSEASIGNPQGYYPQSGLVDHAITPTVGLVWMIGEDFLDRYVVGGIEMHTRNMWARALVRSTLNPARSMANLMAFRVPWHRDTRSNRLGDAVLDDVRPKSTAVGRLPLNRNRSARFAELNVLPVREARQRNTEVSLPTFELAPSLSYMHLDTGHSGSLSCVGGGANAIFNVNRWFGVSTDVDGCKMLSPGKNISGDSLTYVAGPRFTFRNSTGWTPYVQILVGGGKLSTEMMNPALKPIKTTGIPEVDLPVFHASYTSQAQTNSFALKWGAGIDHIVNDAFAVRVIGIEDVHLWARSLNDRHYSNNIALTTGIVLRFGTW